MTSRIVISPWVALSLVCLLFPPFTLVYVLYLLLESLAKWIVRRVRAGSSQSDACECEQLVPKKRWYQSHRSWLGEVNKKGAKRARQFHEAAKPRWLRTGMKKQDSIVEDRFLQQDSQPRCALFKLPWEIRYMIWKRLLVTKRGLHVISDWGKLSHGICAGDECCEAPTNRRLAPQVEYESKSYYSCQACEDRPVITRSKLPGANLMYICRRLYFELAPVLYSENTFHFQQLWTMLDFAESVSSRNLARITRLRIHRNCCWSGSSWDVCAPFCRTGPPASKVFDWPPYDTKTWLTFWGTISSDMTSLESLKIQLWGIPKAIADNDSWYKPILEIRGLRECTFDVWVDSPGKKEEFDPSFQALAAKMLEPKDPMVADKP